MQVLDKSVEYDARRLLCAVLMYFDRNHSWPIGQVINQMNCYKAATNKADVVQHLLDRNLLNFEHESATGHRQFRHYVVTPSGRAEVAPPDPRPPILNLLTPFPEDDVESTIYGYHFMFFKRRGRWPTAVERARAFSGQISRMTSPERRKRAYENLHADGTFVRVSFWSKNGRTNSYILPEYSPEYADKDGWHFYDAPLDKT